MYLRVNDFTHTNRMTSKKSFIHSFNCQLFDRLTSYPSDVWVKIVARMNVNVFQYTSRSGLRLFWGTYYVRRYVEYKYRSARKYYVGYVEYTNTAPRGSRIWWIHQILRKPMWTESSGNINIRFCGWFLRNIFIPASRFSSHTHEFFHALAKRKRFAEHFHSRV